MQIMDDPSVLEEAVTALREELVKDLAESVSLGQSIGDSLYDKSDLISI
tara:strand:- start:1707 stop:1853 length:147 start_codon:yes stop_codon:yes gene_type:complete